MSQALTQAQSDSSRLGYAKPAVDICVPEALQQECGKAGQKVRQVQVKQHVWSIQTFVIADKRGYGCPSCCERDLQQTVLRQVSLIWNVGFPISGKHLLTAVRKKHVEEETTHTGITTATADSATLPKICRGNAAHARCVALSASKQSPAQRYCPVKVNAAKLLNSAW